MIYGQPTTGGPVVPLAYLDDRLVETPRGPVVLQTLAASGLEDEAHRLGQKTFDAPLIRDGYYGGYPARQVERARNPYISKVAIDAHGDLVGFYFVEVASAEAIIERVSEPLVDPEALNGLRVLHGMSLAVAPDWRGAGIGRILRDGLDDTGFDAVLGIATIGLGNLGHWLRHRSLLGYGRHGFLTGRGLGGRRLAFEGETLPAGVVGSLVREAKAIHAEWKERHDSEFGLEHARIMLIEIARRRNSGHPFATADNARLIAETVGMSDEEAARIQAEVVEEA